jgi:flagellar hook protein FlgE
MALNQALSGINAAQSALDVISNNIANAGTVGFKGSTAQFADIYAVTGFNLDSTAIGSGARLAQVAQQFTQGDQQTTNVSTNLYISGNGFFVINNGSGPLYTRNGDFTKSADGYLENPEGYRLQVYPSDGNGGFDTSTLTDLNLNASVSNASATSTITVSSNLPADASVPANLANFEDDAAFDPTDKTSYNNNTPVTIYDSQGGAHQAQIYYAKTGDNTWDARLVIDGQSAGPVQQITFNANGTMSTPADGQLSFTPGATGNGATFPANLTVDVTNTTQFGTDFASGAVSQNGFQAGTLTSVDIGSDGVVTANYSNGQTSQIAQVAMANFANLGGLRQLGNTTWAASTDSGQAVLGVASAGQFGSLISGALESSNTSDTTAQLVDMIQAQRDYQANAQVLSTDNTLATALFNAVSR